jgi:putative phage-type endonuclease
MIKIHPQVERLNRLPQVVQRSEEWFLSRKMRVTASEICCVMGINPYKSRNVYWKEKLSVMRNEPEKERVSSSWISEWGVRYEPIVQEIVRQNYRTKIGVSYEDDPSEVLFEYGMIKHPEISFLGASPDGILADGTMVEIKCPPTRQIEKDEVVPYYYSQLQLQLECCQLEALDFVECKFYEYRSLASFKTDSAATGNLFESLEGNKKGVLLQRGKEYIYYRPEDKESLDEWCERHGGGPLTCPAIGCRYYMWKIEFMVTKRITRNKDYITRMLQETRIFWDSIVVASQDTQMCVCPLPPPNTIYFENFVADNLYIIYKKKTDTHTDADVDTRTHTNTNAETQENDQRPNKKMRSAFKLPE